MKNIILIISICFTQFSFSQWNISTQNCFGGSNNEDFVTSLTLSNGNHLFFCESTSSISGNKTEANIGGADLWIVAMDANLQIIWQKNFGGTLDEYPTNVIETSDHKLLFMSNSLSSIDGTKTAPNYGGSDIWIIKTELDGTVLWDKSYGGDQSDVSLNIVELESGNFAIFGGSDSGISGNKTSPNVGSDDGWFIKIDKNGNILSDITFGGSDSEFVTRGLIYQNNQIIVAYTSFSNISDDKTENSYGDEDYWICKFDTSGVLLDQKTIGGTGTESTSFLHLTTTGYILLVGASDSPISGLKTENSFNSSYDCWVMTLDQNFNILNQKTIGGDNSEFVQSLIFDPVTNHFLIGVSSSSDISTFKTENSKGGVDNWFFIIDENLSVLKDKTIGSNQRDALYSVMPLANSSFMIFSSSNGSVSGDKTSAGYNTGTSSSPSDVWVYILDTDLNVQELKSQSFNVYPNPAKSILNINSNKQITFVILITLDGKIVDQIEVNGDSISLIVESLQPGVYLCNLNFLDNSVSSLRFVKE